MAFTSLGTSATAKGPCIGVTAVPTASRPGLQATYATFGLLPPMRAGSSAVAAFRPNFDSPSVEFSGP